jgi:galactose mutarotase-like enzyme
MIEIAQESSRMTCDPVGGQVLSWQLKYEDSHGNEGWYDVLYQGSEAKRSGIPVLFPFANPLKNDTFDYSGGTMTQHGFGRMSEWLVVGQEENSVIMLLSHEDIAPEFFEVYPFQFEATIQATLIERDLVYTLRVDNLDSRELPIAPGFHPYFPITHGLKSTMRLPEILGFVADDFDWDGHLEGDFYNFHNFTTVLPNDGYALKLSLSNKSRKPDTNHLVVWSQNTSYADYNFVCLEPFTRGTNALNTDPIMVKPGKSWMQTYVFSAEIIPS